jgi:hypothetical protein
MASTSGTTLYTGVSPPDTRNPVHVQIRKSTGFSIKPEHVIVTTSAATRATGMDLPLKKDRIIHTFTPRPYRSVKEYHMNEAIT